MTSEFAKLRERGNLSARHACWHLAHPADLCPFKQERDYQLRSPLSIRPAHRDGVGRVPGGSIPGRPTDGQKAADAMVKAGRSSSASGSGRRSQRRSSRAPHVQAAETSPSIEDRVAVRADPAAAEDGLTPQLVYRFPPRLIFSWWTRTTRRGHERSPLVDAGDYVCTRMVVGFHLSMDRPSRVSIGLCMLNAV